MMYDPVKILMSFDSRSGSDKEKKQVSATELLQKGELRIMLADDDIDDREMFAEVIDEIGMNIRLDFAEDGSELLKLLLAEDKPLPHLIFLDLNMPNKNGQECLEFIRKHERLKNIPVIIYSTSVYQKDIDETFDKGANLYLRKFSSYQDLLVVTRKVITINWNKHKPKNARNNYVYSSKID